MTQVFFALGEISAILALIALPIFLTWAAVRLIKNITILKIWS